LTPEGASEVGGASLLKEDDNDEEEAHDDVYADYGNEKDVHFLSCFPVCPGFANRRNFGAEEGT
jgi:hypothetical protein